MESFEVTSNGEQQGSTSDNIRDVWVFVNDQPLGAYELPATFPVLAEGANKVTLLGGIYLNGISTTRSAYSFYDSYEVVPVLKPNEIVTLEPSIGYRSTADYKIVEGFEVGNVFNNVDRVSGSDVFEGNFSGKLRLDDPLGNVYISSSILNYSITQLTTAAFIELDYRNDHSFEIFLIPNLTSSGLSGNPTFIAGINPSETWNKIYINLTPTVNLLQADDYEIQLVVRLGADEDPNDINVFVDNFKLIHF